jgi:hypothetical protein
VTTWAGPNQEQILVVPEGVLIEFPLPGKFRALTMRLAVAPGAPANAQATLHVLEGDKEIAQSPALRAGDLPHALWSALDMPASVTLKVESAQPGTRMVLIDPVAIRAN